MQLMGTQTYMQPFMVADQKQNRQVLGRIQYLLLGPRGKTVHAVWLCKLLLGWGTDRGRRAPGPPEMHMQNPKVAATGAPPRQGALAEPLQDLHAAPMLPTHLPQPQLAGRTSRQPGAEPAEDPVYMNQAVTSVGLQPWYPWPLPAFNP